jgi:uncharacterized damage-inducible protein DinB
MNQSYIDYAQYNIWANNRLIATMLTLKDAQLTQEFVGSFPTIRATVLHLWMAETGWLSRLKGNGWEASKVSEFSGLNADLFEAWQATTLDFKDFVVEADQEKKVNFEHKGTQYAIPSKEIVQTVCNHGSFHRGQIVMFLRQLGVTTIPPTDYIHWVKEVGMAVN